MKQTIDIEQRSAHARSLFENGLNCAQSVAMAYADLCGIDPKTIEAMTLALGGGLGRQREVCGTVSGASVVLGMVETLRGGDDLKSRTYHLVQQFGNEFRQQHGAIVCRELLGLPREVDHDPTPSPRTAEYYHRRPCADYVEQSARILGQILNEQ